MSASNSNGAGQAFRFADRPGAYAHYPHARQVGNLLFISGMSCRRPDNTHAGVTVHDDGSFEADIVGQTEALLENMKIIVERCGGSMDRLVDLTTFLVSMDDFPGYNDVYNRWFDAETGPTRTTVTVAALPHPHLLIEMKVVALVEAD
jgi:2-aminomuconate deaminase